MGQPVRVCHTDKKQNRGFTMTNVFSTGLITMLLSNHISSEPSWQQKKSLECETCGEDQYTCADWMLVATLPLELENDKDFKHRGRLWDYLLLGGAPFQNITLSTKTRRAAEGGAPSETNTSTVSSGSLLAAGEPPSESGSHGWGRKCCPWGSKGLPWSGSRVLKNLVVILSLPMSFCNTFSSFFCYNWRKHKCSSDRKCKLLPLASHRVATPFFGKSLL